jgi:hypothetical protein
MVYFFDTNSLSVLRNYYPERFPSFWQQFDEAVEDGAVLSVREVFNELQRFENGTWLIDWAQRNKQMFRVPGPEEAQFVSEIFRVPHFRTMVGKQQQLQGLPVADPFVIAAAKVAGGCVVTEEGVRPNAAKIPNVCSHFKVHCTNLQGFLEKVSWAF